MKLYEAALREQRKAAAQRVAERTAERQLKIETLRSPGGLAKADEPARVATRIDRLSRYYPDVRPISPSAVAAADPEAMAAAGAVLERVINTADFVDVRYLEAGFAGARAVGRVNIREAGGRLAGYGTGSLVSPGLLLTNHHVLPDVSVASTSAIELDYQDGLDGRPLQPVLFPFDAERFFLADEELDFALVAVRAAEQELGRFGFNRLIEAEGKAIVGDFVTIVQHPRGEKKQVALRENRIVDVLELFLHYEADTEPGSSGSPVFNDQWEVVALHHASVPAPDHGELGGFVNEGIRVSRLIAFIRAQSLPAAQRALADRLLSERIELPAPVPPAAADRPTPIGIPPNLQVTIPLEISLKAGSPAAGPRSAADVPAGDEAISIDPDYASRKGYDPDFLGQGPLAVPLPTLSDELVRLASVNSLATDEPRHVLAYHHYSAVMNKERRLAFFTAVNIDGALSLRLKRERDRWFFDSRVPREEQTGSDVYAHNDLDLGHLVRRLDPAWGETREAAKLANDDTFHFTNCTPQHKDLNRNQASWAGLEDYILDNADNRDFSASVFNGPVFAPDDDQYRGVQLPRQFWKVAVMVKESGELSATAYLLSQEELIRGLEVQAEAFSYGAYRTYQVPLSRLEELTGLSFGSLPEADPLGHLEATTSAREIMRPEDLVL